MDDIFAVEMMEAEDNLCQIIEDFLMLKFPLIVLDDFFEVSFRGKVSYNDELLVIFERVDILHNEWIVDFLKNLHLAVEAKLFDFPHVFNLHFDNLGC